MLIFQLPWESPGICSVVLNSETCTFHRTLGKLEEQARVPRERKLSSCAFNFNRYSIFKNFVCANALKLNMIFFKIPCEEAVIRALIFKK